MDDDGAIEVRGARVHNLRGVDVDVPRGGIVAFTGVSGSGKSSLAFDTIHAEGRRRYIDALSGYARQFLDQAEPPDVDAVDGLPPTVAIDQKAGAANPRSTVATVTEIHDYLRLLYARVGIPHCPQCGRPIRRQTPEQIVTSVLGAEDGRKVIVLAPIVRGRKGAHLEAFALIRREGLVRARVDGETIEVVDEPPKLAKSKVHHIEAVIDRLVVRDGIRPRLSESIDRALKLGDETLILSEQGEDGSWSDRVLSTRFACPDCGIGIEPPEPRSFSFNSPYGACPACDGLGTVRRFDPDLVLPDRSKSIVEGAIAPLEGTATGKKTEKKAKAPAGLAEFLDRHKLDRKSPLDRWPASAFRGLLTGDPKAGFPGLLPMLASEYEAESSERKRAAFEDYRSDVRCEACGGTRLRPEARAVQVGGIGIHEVAAMHAGAASRFLEGLEFGPELEAIGPPLVRELAGRLRFLDEVGLDYLTLDRAADSLSGGELQRVRLASQIGSGLVGVAYVLDEPTAGLHPSDTDRLLGSLRRLRDAGNSLLVVEHDEAVIRASDWVIDLGPGAGPEGGLVVAAGPPDRLEGEDSLTAAFLRGRMPALPPGDRLATASGWIEVLGASEHNLKGVDVRIPIGALTCVSGVSGSGKSSLVVDVLARAARRALDHAGPAPGAHRAVVGLDKLERVIAVDQSPIGRTSRSTPATYTGVFDEIRKNFALTPYAKLRGYKASRFSFNVRGGRCETCAGAGVRRIPMQFLADLDVICEACGGARYNRATLEARFKGLSIADVLALRVDEALTAFDAVPKVRRGLEALHEAGLGYVTLGQSSTTLSGGEAQRVKLAAELGRPATGTTLYVLDEPTTGLHPADVANLMRVLNRLADGGNAVVVIEHNLDVIRAADWVIDLGPGGGEDGGRVVAMGPPSLIVAAPEGATGRYLVTSAIESGAPRRRTRRVSMPE